MDELLEALSDAHRRRLLVVLLDHDPQREDIDIPTVIHEGEKELATLRLELRHSHLPRLEDAGLIRWDRDSGEVLKGPRFDDIRPLLEVMRNRGDELPDSWLRGQPATPINGRSR